VFCNEVRYPQLHILSTKHVFGWLLDHLAEYSLTKLRFLATCHSIPSSVQQKSLAELYDALRSHTCTSLCLSPLGLVEKAGVTFSTFLLSGEVTEKRAALTAVHAGKRRGSFSEALRQRQRAPLALEQEAAPEKSSWPASFLKWIG
jgi:hypothetical protein